MRSIQEEYEGAELEDRRLNARVKRMAGELSARPDSDELFEHLINGEHRFVIRSQHDRIWKPAASCWTLLRTHRSSWSVKWPLPHVLITVLQRRARFIRLVKRVAPSCL
jgi:hypothetical protein